MPQFDGLNGVSHPVLTVPSQSRNPVAHRVAHAPLRHLLAVCGRVETQVTPHAPQLSLESSDTQWLLQLVSPTSQEVHV